MDLIFVLIFLAGKQFKRHWSARKRQDDWPKDLVQGTLDFQM
jgi:hypothetical protein